MDVTYKRNTYKLTINYLDTAGNTLAPSYTAEVRYGDTYEVASPEVEGYTPQTAKVTDTMPARDVEVTVFYAPASKEDDKTGENTDGNGLKTEFIDDYGTALGLGNVSLNAGDCFE